MPKRIGKNFLSKDPTERVNSEMIRRLLYDTIFYEFDRDLDAASDAFFKKTNSSEDRRGYDTLISPNSLQKAILDKHFISYAQLNALAKYYDVPISVMLLFTRIRDELEDISHRTQNNSKNILKALRHAIDYLDSISDELSISDKNVLDVLGHHGFKEYINSYKDNLDPVWVQTQFPL